MLRPRPTRWFEILAARDDATLVLEALARTGAVEIEARDGAATPADPAAVMPLLAQFDELSARYQAYWPDAAACRPSAFPQAPLATLQQALDRLQAWSAEAEPLIRALQGNAATTAELLLWRQVLDRWPGDSGLPHELAGAGPLLAARLCVLPAGVEPADVLGAAAPEIELLHCTLPAERCCHMLVAGRSEALQALGQRVASAKGSMHAPPAWAHVERNDNRAEIDRRLHDAAQARAQQDEQMQALAQRHALARTLGDAHRVRWLLHNVQALESGGLFCWITGWSSDPQGQALAHALRHSGARALLHLATAPSQAHAPLLLHNPPWARPFEIFSRALGMPSASEADPTPLLAVVVPLMFGYMFGDVGQGLLIAAVAWWLRDRFPIARLLFVGGLSAAAFGLLFGSVFSVHGLLPALWLHPLEQPLAVLLAPLLGGAVLLTLGLALDALAAWWRGEWQRWALGDAALLVVYLGLLAAFVWPPGLWLAAAGALHFCVGHAVLARRGAAAVGAIGELVEKSVQIMINTLSFARVGAFALAHAGLSSAIVALMDAAHNHVVQALVLLVGNVVVIVLEVMVVSIQTTRLVLFEFFTRFMQGRGRAFRPLPPPPFSYQEH
jgi:V/A-type H+-transporting ATPase subunit I